MSANEDQNSIISIGQRQFDLYALALGQGPNFYPEEIVYRFQTRSGLSCGCILRSPDTDTFSTLSLRRREDHCWVKVANSGPWQDISTAFQKLTLSMCSSEIPESLPPGARRRTPLLKLSSRKISAEFDLLTSSMSHYPALMTIGECYLALPNPDANFVSDFQTENFPSRLFELYLLACFREQGLYVKQEHVSPDFMIEKEGVECWIEAVTANPTTRKEGLSNWVFAPEDRDERLSGNAAERFAKTLRSKLQRNYHELPHVRGKPFALAIADFHESGSMVWSREALATYLYGIRADIIEEGKSRRAVGTPIMRLTGAHGIPAGLFLDPSFAHLSAVIFSNAATLSKFNRMGFLAGWRPPGLNMKRDGIFFDRTPGAVEPIPFEFTVGSAEYEALWPWGEAWCQELEVYHNPLAKHPIPFDLIPGATHWFDRNGEIECDTIWKNSVLSSITHLYMDGAS